MALLASFALLLQTIAPLSPMPAPRIATIEDLAWALTDICTADTPAGPRRPAAPGRFHDCQICLSIDLAGHYVTPSAVALTLPAALARMGWRAPASPAPIFARAVGVQPRGPPAIA
jgi:hypothetical protein